MTDVELTLCLCLHNAAGRLERFLPGIVSALDGAGLPAELLMVDDGSTDDTVELATELAPAARLVRHEVNRGLSAARNTAAEHARGAWLLYLDDDVELAPGALRTLWEARVGEKCVVPLLRRLDGTLQNAVVVRRSVLDERLVSVPHPLERTAYPTGAAFLIERAAYLAVGGCDERVTIYYDDVLLGMRLRAAGITIRMIDDATVIHHTRGGDRSPEREARARTLNDRHRWLATSEALEDSRRLAVLALGGPRMALKSLVSGSWSPMSGWLWAMRELRR